MKQTYKVSFPFSNGDYYIEIREGKRFVDWLKVGSVPEILRCLVLNPDEKHESVRCQTKKVALELSRALRLHE